MILTFLLSLAFESVKVEKVNSLGVFLWKYRKQRVKISFFY